MDWAYRKGSLPIQFVDRQLRECSIPIRVPEGKALERRFTFEKPTDDSEGIENLDASPTDCSRSQSCTTGRRLLPVDTRLLLPATWAALMLTYLLENVLRVFAGHFKPGEVDGVALSQWSWLGISVVMAIPIVMVLLSLTIGQPALRWIHIAGAAILFIFNAVGLPSYEGWYDRFLIVLGLDPSYTPLCSSPRDPVQQPPG